MFHTIPSMNRMINLAYVAWVWWDESKQYPGKVHVKLQLYCGGMADVIYPTTEEFKELMDALKRFPK
jgi:hypothetical protein